MRTSTASSAEPSSSLAIAGGLLVRAQDETRNGEWRSSGGDSAYTRYSPLAQITRDNVKNLRIPVAPSGARPAVEGAVSEAPDQQLSARDADDDRRRAVRAGLRRPPRSVRCRHGRDDLAAGAGPRHGERDQRVEHARRGLLEGRIGSPPVHRPERLSLCARPARQSASTAFGNGGRVRLVPDGRAQLRLELRPDRRRRRGRHRRQPGWRGRRRHRSGKGARRRTCAASTRGTASCSGRSTSCRTRASSGPTRWGNESGQVLRRSGFVVLHLGGRSARLRLYPADRADRRVLRRIPARRQPLLQHAGRAQRQDRQARLAFSDGAPRPVGVRPHRSGDARARSRSMAGGSRR